jgi:hypothetical protein
MKQPAKKRFLLSLAVGFALAVVFVTVATSLMPGVGANVFLFPGELLVPVVGPLVPSSVVYAVVPEGGPVAAVALFVFGSFLFWWLLFVVGIFFLVFRNWRT